MIVGVLVLSLMLIVIGAFWDADPDEEIAKFFTLTLLLMALGVMIVNQTYNQVLSALAKDGAIVYGMDSDGDSTPVLVDPILVNTFKLVK